MNLSTVLEVTIGMIVVYYVLSLIVAAINSQILLYTEQRAKDLKAGLKELLTDDKKRKEFWDSALIKNLAEKRVSFFKGAEFLPTLGVSSIPPATFAKAVIGMMPQDATGEVSLAEMKKTLQSYGIPTSGIDQAEQASKALESWFDDKMMSISSLFRQHAKRIAIFVALVVTLVVGADSIEIFNTLSDMPAARAALALKTNQMLAEEPEADVESLVAGLEMAAVPLLWQGGLPNTAEAWALKTLGLLITWAAIAQGSAFWYQILGKVRSVATSASSSSSGTN